MKIFISALIAILFFSVQSKAQLPVGNPITNSTGWIKSGYVQNDSAGIAAKRDTLWQPRYTGSWVYWQHAGVDSAFWVFNGKTSGKKWDKLVIVSGSASPGTGTVTSIATGFGLSPTSNPITTTGTIKADTSHNNQGLMTWSDGTRRIDSLGVLKLNISDTASMLNNYNAGVGYGLIKNVKSPFVDTFLIIPYTDTLKVNGIATKSDIRNSPAGTVTSVTASSPLTVTNTTTTPNISISLPFVRPEDYGGANTTGILAAVATGKNVWLTGGVTYPLTSTVTLNSGQGIFSNGDAIISINGITAIIPGQSSQIVGVRFQGTKTSGSSSTEYAIKMHVNPYNMINNCVFVEIATNAIYYDSTSITNIISNNRFYNCKVAIKGGAQGEYAMLANNRMQLCDTGYSIIGGNNSIVGGNATDGSVGLYVGADLVNEGHFTVTGFTSNHNTYNLYVENLSIKNSVLFNSCNFQVGNILIKNSSFVEISSGILDILGNTFTNDNSFIKVLFNSWRSAPSLTEINGATHIFRDNQLNYTSPTTADSITWMSLGTLASSDFKGQGGTGQLLQGSGGTSNNPSWTSNINISGSIAANTLTLTNSASVGGALTVTGNAIVGGNLTVTGTTTATIFSGSGSSLTGVVNTIGVTTGNGVSASSSGGQNPRLSFTLGAITPTTVTASSTLQGSGGTFTQGSNGGTSLTFTNFGSIITRTTTAGNIQPGLQYSTLGNNNLTMLASSNAGTAGYGVNIVAYNSAVYYRGLVYNNVSIGNPTLRLQQDGGVTDIGSASGDSLRVRWLPTGKQLKAVYADALGYLYQADTTVSSGGGISGLTINYIPKATSATTIADGQIYDDGTTVQINGSIGVTSKFQVTAQSGSNVSAVTVASASASSQKNFTGVNTSTGSTTYTVDATGVITSDALSGTSTQLVSVNASGQLVRSTSSAPISGSFSGVGTATTTFTVTIGSTQPNNTYKVVASPSNALSAAVFYINNKTTTTFDVVYLAGLTGSVAFDWVLAQ